MDNGAMHVYVNRSFGRFAKKARIADADLINAAELANQGLIDADLGGGVIKQRIARKGEGESGGSRCILVFRRADRAVYVHGFEKKDKANIDQRELEALREIAGIVLGYSDGELARQVDQGTFTPDLAEGVTAW